jgi:hypothetical protein
VSGRRLFDPTLIHLRQNPISTAAPRRSGGLRPLSSSAARVGRDFSLKISFGPEASATGQFGVEGSARGTLQFRHNDNEGWSIKWTRKPA